MIDDRAARLRAARTPFVLATVVAVAKPQSARAGSKAIVLADGAVEGWFGGGCVRPLVVREALDALERDEPRLLHFDGDGAADASGIPGVKVFPMTCQGEGGLSVFLEPVLPRPSLVVLGATPVAAAVARLATEIGFAVRASGLEATLDLEAGDAIIVATMGSGDEEALRAAVDSAAGWIALVASRRKGDFLIEYVRGLGVAPDRLARVKYPAGLDLGGNSPEEVALSVCAEVVAFRHGKLPSRGASTPAAATPPAPLARRAARALSLAPLATDPVCGMQVDPATAAHVLTHEGRTWYFCCPRCRAAFEREPARYAETRA